MEGPILFSQQNKQNTAIFFFYLTALFHIRQKKVAVQSQTWKIKEKMKWILTKI